MRPSVLLGELRKVLRVGQSLTYALVVEHGPSVGTWGKRIIKDVAWDPEQGGYIRKMRRRGVTTLQLLPDPNQAA